MVKDLLLRLEAIAQEVKASGRGVALLGLGSAGQGLARLDEFSDLDFFVIAKEGHKAFFLDSLAWLERIQPVVFSFRNTADGYKLLFADGIFCEMAVFEAEDLAGIPYSQARVVWQDKDSAFTFQESNKVPPPAADLPTVDWLVGEALSNLFVGLGRFQRGEKLTAVRFIQGYAVQRILELTPFIEDSQNEDGDVFDQDRRFEQRYPETAAALPSFMQGYEKSPQSVRAILEFLDRHFALNEGMKTAVLAICESLSDS